MKLSYPLKEISINQPFGSNPDYYAKFGWKGHSGIDFKASHGTPVYSPCDGVAYYVTDAHGGDGIYVHTHDEKGNWYNIIHWHLISHDDPSLAPPIPRTGFYPVKEGALLGYADNSGAPYESSGDHLHFAVMPCNANYAPLDPSNGYGGCTDPTPFLPTPQAEIANGAEQAIMQATQILHSIAQSPEPPSIKSTLLESIKVAIQAIENLL